MEFYLPEKKISMILEMIQKLMFATFLGFVVESLKMKFYFLEKKIEKIQYKINELLAGSWVYIQEVASVVGNIQAGSRALGAQAPGLSIGCGLFSNLGLEPQIV